MRLWWQRRYQALLAALAGLRWAWRESHFRIHLMAAVGVIFLAASTGLAAIEWSVLLLCIALVMAFEAMNSALEALADALHPDEHPMVGQAKDMAAAAVLVSAVIAVVVALLIFIPAWFG